MLKKAKFVFGPRKGQTWQLWLWISEKGINFSTPSDSAELIDSRLVRITRSQKLFLRSSRHLGEPVWPRGVSDLRPVLHPVQERPAKAVVLDGHGPAAAAGPRDRAAVQAEQRQPRVPAVHAEGHPGLRVRPAQENLHVRAGGQDGGEGQTGELTLWHLSLPRARAGHFQYFLFFLIIKNDFLHFLSS